MRVQIIGIESRKGTGKESGNPYQINSMIGMMEVPESQRIQRNEHNVLTVDGFKVWRENVDDDIYRRIVEQSQGQFPLYVDFQMEERLDQKDKLYNAIVGVTFD